MGVSSCKFLRLSSWQNIKRWWCGVNATDLLHGTVSLENACSLILFGARRKFRHAPAIQRRQWLRRNASLEGVALSAHEMEATDCLRQGDTHLELDVIDFCVQE
jgi:hypothetical protein